MINILGKIIFLGMKTIKIFSFHLNESKTNPINIIIDVDKQIHT